MATAATSTNQDIMSAPPDPSIYVEIIAYLLPLLEELSDDSRLVSDHKDTLRSMRNARPSSQIGRWAEKDVVFRPKVRFYASEDVHISMWQSSFFLVMGISVVRYAKRRLKESAAPSGEALQAIDHARRFLRKRGREVHSSRQAMFVELLEGERDVIHPEIDVGSDDD